MRAIPNERSFPISFDFYTYTEVRSVFGVVGVDDISKEEKSISFSAHAVGVENFGQTSLTAFIGIALCRVQWSIWCEGWHSFSALRLAEMYVIT